MNNKAAKIASLSLVLGVCSFVPPLVATILHAIRLKKKEIAARKRKSTHGCRYPKVDVPRIEVRSMERIISHLREEPFNPLPLGGLTSTLIFSMSDLIPMMLESRKSTCGKVYRYPDEFERVVFESLDGTPLCAMVGIHEDGRPRPALIMVHGLFGSKNVWFSQQVVLSAYYGWGYNVMALDLRFFGESKLMSDAPGTGGWKEGEDIIAAARYMKTLPHVTSVAVMGGSYGGAAAMCAAYMSEPKDVIDGGIISWGGYGYIPEQVDYISRTPAPYQPFFPVYLFFMGCYTLTLGGRVREFRNFSDFLRHYSAPYYGVDPEVIFERSSAALHFDEIGTPLLVVNAEDDPVIPAAQAELMEERARSNPFIEVLRMPKGGHCAFTVVDKAWMSSLVRGFYNYWAKLPAAG